MLDYFLSSDWAIIATELLAGFIVISLILAILVWRGQRRHTGAAERLLDDRDPIMRASEEMVDRQIQRVWPELKLDDEQRETYAERSLDAIEGMVEPWLEPKRYELAAVARRFLQVRQADLEQLLTLARAQAEQSDADESRIAELEGDIKELREQRDRQAKQLNESLETVNVMVREYGRKFDYNEEPHVATVLKAIVMVQEMEAGADCETAKRRADDVFSEDLVATSSAPAEAENDPAPAPASDADASTPEDEAQSPALSPEEEMAAAMEAEAAGQQPDDATDATAQEPAPQAAGEPTSADEAQTEATPAAEAAVGEATDETTSQAPTSDSEAENATTAADDTDDIDQLIESAAQAKSENDAIEAGGQQPTPSEDAAEPKSAGTAPTADDAQPESTGAPDEASNDQDTSAVADDSQEQSESAEQADERDLDEVETPAAEPEENENGVIDLDDVEIPKEEEKGKDDDKEQEFDLDDIDALLDAEIARKHGKDS
ncbi:hypothetical protein FAZ79_01525 [Guyparkeria sp. SB14A]|uniref:hypothetical protein n=1 Tax=Guyparkeria sp. SB14A TaxID=2571147 RepID=UPI0010AC9238|nr:hypothetical protein [Guyparkeria sp. SB14A]TKA91244.1 hypothetical protein FAZ79_01525 [Guyparkeria sp. SB14A]